MTEDELSRLHSFIKGYEELCNAVGVHLSARAQDWMEVKFHDPKALVLVEYDKYENGNSVTTEIELPHA